MHGVPTVAVMEGRQAPTMQHAGSDKTFCEFFAGIGLVHEALRRSGWKGHGPIPWSHEPNRGFLRALAALGRAAAAIGEEEEAQRCRTFLRDSSAEAADALA